MSDSGSKLLSVDTGIDEERFVFWDKFARPQGEAVGKYEYLIGSNVGILHSWWIDPEKIARLN